jgi:ribosomal protein S18 acetylase RimI-like enzyme
MIPFQQKYIFYCGESDNINLSNINLEKDYSFSIWKPKFYQITPKGLFFPSLCAWWFFHFLRIFSNYNYRIFLIYYKNKKAVHYSVVQPKHFKTPFMGENDLQIGPVGTNENHRRKGLASYVINKIINFYKGQDIKFWYLTREENEPSRRLIENLGFKECGEGIKKKIFIGGLFDTYIIKKKF